MSSVRLGGQGPRGRVALRGRIASATLGDVTTRTIVMLGLLLPALATPAAAQGLPFRAAAYREMTKIFLENLPWLPVIQPYEDYGLQKYVDFTPNPNQQFEIRRFNFRFRRA